MPQIIRKRSRAPRPTPFLPPSLLLLLLLFLVLFLLPTLDGKSDGITITRDDDDLNEEAGREGRKEEAEKEKQQQQQRQKQQHEESKPNLFLYQRPMSQADLIEDGYTCFVTGECMACSAEEMVREGGREGGREGW